MELDEAEPASPAPGTKPARHPLVHRLIQLARVLVSLLVVAAVAYAVVHEWHEVSHTLSLLSWQSVVLSLLSVLLGMFATVKVWQHLLHGVGRSIPYAQAAQINLVGQLGKYLPGSVWSFVLQAELGRRYRVPRGKALVALLLSAGMSIVTALTLSVLAIHPLLGKWGGAAWLLACGPLTLLTCLPRVLTRVANLVMRLLRRPQLKTRIDGRQILWALGWSFVSWLLFGLHLWALASSLGALSPQGYALATGAFGLAMSAGFIAFVLPSGVGVREAIIVAGLSPILASGPALAFALTSRLLFTVCDVSTAAISAIVARATQPVPPPEDR
jgi:uncharacterized membrane protein YbhN (UPF0104 family)